MRIGTVGLGGLLCIASLAYVWNGGGGAAAQAPPARKAAEHVPLLPELSAPIHIKPPDENIIKLLEMKITLDVKAKPLEDVMQQFGKLTNGSFVLDRAGLDAVSVDVSTPITFLVHDAPVRTVLRLILRPLNLTYIVQDGILVITDDERGSRELVTWLFPVADLVGSTPPDHFARMVDNLMANLQDSVDSDTWEDNGGSATMSFSSASLALIVTTTEESQEKLQVFLTRLREAQQRAKAQLRAAGLPELAALQTALHQARRDAEKKLADELRPKPSPPHSNETEALRKQAADAHRVAEKALRLALDMEKQLADLKAQVKPPAADKANE